jgi:CBS domain-containing protein
MVSIPTVELECNVQLAASILVEARSPILAVVDSQGNLTGVLTEWDITRAAAQGAPETLSIEGMMSKQVVSAEPADTILEMVRKLEYHEISAMPVVANGKVLGMVSTDLLARRSLLRLLQSQIE